MKIKRKITLSLAFTLIGLAALIIFIVALNFRTYGIESAIEKSKITSELVRDGLTVHMINGIMDKRDFFMRKIASSKNIEQLWVVRSPSVVEQFGAGLDGEGAKDSIDSEVLSTGVSKSVVSESGEKVSLRVTVPYIANYLDNPNCLQCHIAKEGEVLGAVSMVFDISAVRTTGTITVFRIIAVAVVVLIFVILVANLGISRYLELFEDVTESIKNGYEGDFSSRIKTRLKDEGGDMAHWLNMFYERLNSTIEHIDKKISILIGGVHSKSDNPLERTRDIVDELVDIYKFKKTIELDKDKDEVYERIVSIIRSRVGDGQFALFEVNHISCTRKLIYSSINSDWYCTLGDGSQACNGCRALRTGTNVMSDDFESLCAVFQESDKFDHICLPYRVTEQNSLLVSVVTKKGGDIEAIKEEIDTFRNYFEAARPVLESRYLMAILRESNLRDGLTGLYNRKFLDEFVDHLARQATRSKVQYAVLMLDIDYFKMVNDTYGHDIGDVIIKGLSDTVRESIRESDLAVRFGGEEFLILLHNSTEEGAMKVAEKIRESFAKKSFSTGSEQIKKTVSVGVALYPVDADGIWRVIKFADVALYKAKGNGRNRVARFASDMVQESENY